MIVYDLICEAEHRFEAWFSSMEDFERQAGTPMLVCPVCGSGEVRRAPAGIHTRRPGSRSAPSQMGTPEAMDNMEAIETEPDHGHVAAFPDPKQVVRALRRILKNAENVGERFPEEARRIHYGEAPKRIIRGQASREDTDALREEGIEVVNLPVPPVEDLH
jgi:hypothetical protein